jgi:hypothetical protein
VLVLIRAEFVLFDVFYEDGSRPSNRQPPKIFFYDQQMRGRRLANHPKRRNGPTLRAFSYF